MNVLAIDPGKATGVAGQYDDPSGLMFWSTILPWYEAMELVEQHLASGNVDLVVCEDYRISKHTLSKGADAHWPMGGIGVVTYFATKYEVKAVKYSPSEAKTFSTDAKLKKIGWHKTGAGHDNDAARHLLLALVNAKAFDLKLLL